MKEFIFIETWVIQWNGIKYPKGSLKWYDSHLCKKKNMDHKTSNKIRDEHKTHKASIRWSICIFTAKHFIK